jgi:hypothetical protein
LGDDRRDSKLRLGRNSVRKKRKEKKKVAGSRVEE